MTEQGEGTRIGKSGGGVLSARDVYDCLDEALAEHDRDPRTDVWRSFWDRMTDGYLIPDRPSGGNTDE